MANIVIAGVVDSPHFARVEMLADHLEKNLPDFQVQKIVKSPEDWDMFIWELCYYENWKHPVHPAIAWREPVLYGSRRMLIGGPSDFQEYSMCYYGVEVDYRSCDLVKVAKENAATKVAVDEEDALNRQTKPLVNITVTNAGCAICYNFMSTLLTGFAFGHDNEINIVLFDKPEKLKFARALQMEIIDCASEFLRSVVVTTDNQEAFADADVIILMEENWQETWETADQFSARAWSQFSLYGSLFDWIAKSTVRIVAGVTKNGIFVGNFVLMALSSGFVSRPELGRNMYCCGNTVAAVCKAVIAEHLDIMSAELSDICVFGGRMFADSMCVYVDEAKVHNCSKWSIDGPKTYWRYLREVMPNLSEFQKDLLEEIGTRTEKETHLSGQVSAICLSNGIAKIFRHLDVGDGGKRLHSLGICSQGWYGVPHGLPFYFPVRFIGPGKYKVIEDLKLSDSTVQEIKRICDLMMAHYEKLQQPVVTTFSHMSLADSQRGDDDTSSMASKDHEEDEEKEEREEDQREEKGNELDVNDKEKEESHGVAVINRP